MNDKAKRVRVNMRIPLELVEFIKEDAKRRGTNMTGDYVDYLKTKKDRTEKEGRNVHK